MECYHGVVSMNHTVNGILRMNNEEIDFENGKGYIEKDWGTSFPEKYIWIQCNNFSSRKTSVFCSVANIPYMKKSFLGFICNILIEGKEYRFATYNNSTMHVESILNGKIILLLENKEATLRLEANIRETAELIAPKLGRMEKIIKEGLSGGTKFCLYDKQKQIKFEDVGSMAGIEIVGF
jgi:tocopherol cyclase